MILASNYFSFSRVSLPMVFFFMISLWASLMMKWFGLNSTALPAILFKRVLNFALSSSVMFSAFFYLRFGLLKYLFLGL